METSIIICILIIFIIQAFNFFLKKKFENKNENDEIASARSFCGFSMSNDDKSKLYISCGDGGEPNFEEYDDMYEYYLKN